jgi:hypothetical protein
MTSLRPIQLYQSHADPIWPDSTFKYGSELDDNVGIAACVSS